MDFLIKTDYVSPNFNERASGVPLDLIILHYTAMASAPAALSWLCNPESSVSCHFLIDEQGDIFQLVDTSMRAWHAGKSFWKGTHDINSRSIGIELANTGFAPYPRSLLRSLEKLLTHLTRTHEIPPHHILGHSDIAPGRKIDPGAHFPWQHFADKGFGQRICKKNLKKTNGAVQDLQKYLQEFGFDSPITSAWDTQTEKNMRAFLHHFSPEFLEKTNELPGLITYASALLRRWKENSEIR